MTDVDRGRIRVTVRAADADLANTVIAGIAAWWTTDGCARVIASEHQVTTEGGGAEASIDFSLPQQRSTGPMEGDPKAAFAMPVTPAPAVWSLPPVTVDATKDALLQFPAESAPVTSRSVERSPRVGAGPRARNATVDRRWIAIAAGLLAAAVAASLLRIELPRKSADDTTRRAPVLDTTDRALSVMPDAASPPPQPSAPAAKPLSARRRQPALPTVSSPFPPVGNGYTATLVVRSEPAGGAVAIDGVRVGVTPVRVTNLPVGSHALHVTVEGHPLWSTAARIVYGRENHVLARITDVASAAGR